jgi:hypothetical protein
MIGLKLAVDFLYVIYIKRKQMLIFNLILALLWTGKGSSVRSVAFLGYRAVKYNEKHEFRERSTFKQMRESKTMLKNDARNETVMYMNVMAKERIGLDELIHSRLRNSVVKEIKFYFCYTEPAH